MARMLTPAMVLALFFATAAQAQQQKGDIELQLAGSFFTTVASEVSINVGTLSGKIGPFITDNIQIGIGPTLTITTSTTTTVAPVTGRTTTSSKTSTTFGSTAFITYSFLIKDTLTVPYAGASFYKRDFGDRAERGWLGVNGGVRYFLTRRTSIDVSANYLTTLTPGKTGGMLLFAFGLSILV